MYDVVALGELLIDFTPAGLSINDNFLYEQNPGGAPANVLAVLARFGAKTGFIGKLGKDQFGYFLVATLKNMGVSLEGIAWDDEYNTTLAFVHLNQKGDRMFSFYRNPGADMMLTKDELNLEMIRHSRIFHFGSISMTHEPARSATIHAVEYAKHNGLIISYDPNYRPSLWKNTDEAKRYIKTGMAYADILKVSEEELQLITGMGEIHAAAESLYSEYHIPLIIVTLGRNGCYYKREDDKGYIPTYRAETIDTTGAGDGFLGALLYQILMSNKGINHFNASELESILKFSNATGALMTMKRGAIPAIPTLEQVNDFMKVQPFELEY